MNTSPAVLLTVFIGLTCALPPFELKRSGAKSSEAALEWIRHLQKERGEITFYLNLLVF